MNDGDSRDHSEVAVIRVLEAGLEELGFAADSARADQLSKLVFLLHDWAARINLTGHRDALAIAERLVLDAAALAKSLPELEAARSLADLGTGAGFPGLPVAILYPHVQVRLVDSRKKRNHFQRAAKRALGLPNVDPILGRSDEVAQHPSDIVVAQAMAQPEIALELMAQWAAPGATLALPASEAATPPLPVSGFGPPELREYVVPSTAVHRKIWVFRALDRD